MAIGTTGAIIAASAVGAGASMIGSKKAADAQKSASNSANALQQYMFDTARADSMPFMDAGRNALAALQYEMGLGARPMVDNPDGNPRLFDRRNDLRDKAEGNPSASVRRMAERKLDDPRFDRLTTPFQGFEATPGYEFQREEGTRAIDASAAARGLTRSGATLKAQERFGQGIAAQEYGNYLARLGSMAGFGQTSTNQTNALGVQTGAGMAQNTILGGQARGSAYQQMGQAAGGFAGNALSGLAYGGYLQPRQPAGFFPVTG